MEEYDVIVIGAGIIGLMVAYKLSHFRLKVLVLDSNPEPGWGISKGHAAVVHVVQLPFNSLKSKLARRGNKELLKICDRLGVRYRRTSTLILATRLLHIIALPLVYLYLKLNLKGFPVKLLSKSRLKRMEPNLSDKVLGGIEVRGYAVVDSFDLVYGLNEFCSENGVEFHFEEKVKGISPLEDAVKVVTDRGSYLTSYLVNAAGLYADEMAKLTGDGVEFELGKGVLIVFEKPVSKNLLAPLYLKPDPKTKGGAIMFTFDGRGLWGPNLRPARDKEDTSVDELDYKMIMEKFSGLIKSEIPVPIKAYAGIRPIPPENDFLVRRSSKSEKIVHILGTESPGFTASPALASLVLDMLEEAGLKLEAKGEMVERKPFRRMRDDPRGGRVICPCNLVTEEEVREAVRRGSRTLQGVMFRTGLGMGMCQGSRCLADALEVIADELGVSPEEVTLKGDGSWIVTS